MYRFIFVLILLILFDFYVYKSLSKYFIRRTKWIKVIATIIYWLIPIIFFTLPIYFHWLRQFSAKNYQFNKLYFGAGFAIIYIPKFIIMSFQAIEDITKFIARRTKKKHPVNSNIYKKADGISRSVFISRMGLLVSAVPFTSLIYSIGIGRFNFQIKKQILYFDHLPKAFDGFKIVQFSDLHAGSLIGQQNEFKEAIEMINQQNADIVVFTGDFINDKAEELENWIPILSTLKAKAGKFSVLGNHDYGEYLDWNNEDDKIANFDKLKRYNNQMGFNLILNDSVIFEKNGEKIALLGVENWGEKRFPQMGRLDLAMEKASDIPFKVLLSHDPSHWDAQVNGKTDIALTLSGHTHGLQMALNVGNYSWSPISHKYKRWKGLYTENNQHLYVNIGLGYIYFPGRFGADPEITVFELKSKS